MSQKKRVVGFDLETGSANRLYTWDQPEPFIVLCGWIEDGITHVTNDPAELIAVLMAADVIYGQNIYAFDIPALAVHAGADYEALMAKAVDIMILAQEEDPPAPKTMPVVRFDLRTACPGIDTELQKTVSSAWGWVQMTGTYPVQFRVEGNRVSMVQSSAASTAYRPYLRAALAKMDCAVAAAEAQEFKFLLVIRDPEDSSMSSLVALIQDR